MRAMLMMAALALGACGEGGGGDGAGGAGGAPACVDEPGRAPCCDQTPLEAADCPEGWAFTSTATTAQCMPADASAVIRWETSGTATVSRTDSRPGGSQVACTSSGREIGRAARTLSGWCVEACYGDDGLAVSMEDCTAFDQTVPACQE